MPTWFQRVENAAIGLAAVVGFVHAGFAWWWLLALFIAFDVSMIGYVGSPVLGAWTYNAIHSYIGPGVLLAFALLADLRWALFVGLVWAFHIAVDRLLGYGLKFTTGFEHTHLGDIGKARSTGAT